MASTSLPQPGGNCGEFEVCSENGRSEVYEQGPSERDLVRVLTWLEPCDTYRIREDRRKKQLELRRERANASTCASIGWTASLDWWVLGCKLGCLAKWKFGSTDSTGWPRGVLLVMPAR